MLRVPSCSTSAYCATSPTSPGETTSVTTLRPVSARAAAIIFNADSPSPWNEYGEVRGLNDPRRTYEPPGPGPGPQDSISIPTPSTINGPPMTPTSYLPTSPPPEPPTCPPRRTF